MCFKSGLRADSFTIWLPQLSLSIFTESACRLRFGLWGYQTSLTVTHILISHARSQAKGHRNLRIADIRWCLLLIHRCLDPVTLICPHFWFPVLHKWVILSASHIQSYLISLREPESTVAMGSLKTDWSCSAELHSVFAKSLGLWETTPLSLSLLPSSASETCVRLWLESEAEKEGKKKRLDTVNSTEKDNYRG